MFSFLYFFFLMIRRPPRSTRTDTLFPYTTLFRSAYTSEGLEGSLAQTVIPFQPKWQANASFDYKIAAVMMDTSLILNGDFHYQTYYRAGDIPIPGYMTVDLRATLAGIFGGGVIISIFVKNLFYLIFEIVPCAYTIVVCSV